MNLIYPLSAIARLPMPGDNVAIATRRLEGGTVIEQDDEQFTLSQTVLEGHRFAVRPIAPGEALLSWELPFGIATQPIAPGDYVCNASMLESLAGRQIGLELPAAPNFQDCLSAYTLDEASFRPGEQVPLYDQPRTFLGYRRGPGRGVGTRNHIVILGVTSHTASYARLLAERLSRVADDYPNIDGIVAVAHTEGGGKEVPNNRDLLLRTLAGFMVNPNVGAVLAVDSGQGAITGQQLQGFMRAAGYPLDQVLYRFFTLQGGFLAALQQGETIVRGWLQAVNATSRTEEPAAHLKLALQCGGSDAFSGVSGNPLAGWVARELLRHGGSANLAETDELMGAESYLLQNVRDLETARRFLATLAHFEEWANWHGASGAANPSAGNKLRGLYNIALKSIGAARKRDPAVRLDFVIAYGEPMTEPGFYFMDSPGNDLESIAGQVASGCNLILFTTGNGSVTNFPFVPTIKIMTTTSRYRLLEHEMDVNAGAYLDGTPMDELGRQTLDLTFAIASGRPSQGERAGHWQVSLWRDWRQTDRSRLASLLSARPPKGESLRIQTEPPDPCLTVSALRCEGGYVTDRLGLVLPASLCSAQIARLAAEQLNAKRLGCKQGISRFVALPHTEGCGSSSGPSEQLFCRTLLGYLTHPLVAAGLVLEHGCERTPNDYLRNQLEEMGFDPGRFGWASVQLDGGIERALTKIETWFVQALASLPAAVPETVGLGVLKLGLVADGPISQEAARALARLTRLVVGAGGTVVVPENAALLQAPAYLKGTLGERQAEVTLAYGQRIPDLSGLKGSLYIMEAPTQHWVETLTGLGATGVEMMVGVVSNQPMQGHPLVPLLQVKAGSPGKMEGEQRTTEATPTHSASEDVDLVLAGEPDSWGDELLHLVLRVAERRYTPRLAAQGNVDFQVTRGLLGVSL